MVLQAWSVSDVRSAEATLMERLPEGELMQRAAKGLSKVLRSRVKGRPGPARVVGLVGSGGNGGDTLYALARLARKESAAGVAALLLSERGVHTSALDTARRCGVQIVDALTAKAGDVLAIVAEADILVDGVTGIGGRPGWQPIIADLIEEILEAAPRDAHIIAVDLPSGADPAGEHVEAASVWADETVTFGVPKPVHVLATEPRCGVLTVVDIGLTPQSIPTAERLDHDDVAGLWPIPLPDDDKYSRGVLGVVAGSSTYSGAAVLTVLGAICSGAGMVRYIGPQTPSDLVRAAAPEAVITPTVRDTHVNAWVVGPGIDATDTRSRAAAKHVDDARLALSTDTPQVIDAGGLELLDGPVRTGHEKTLLTPHAGELARLLHRLAGEQVDRQDIKSAPVTHARRAADLLDATVLLKGRITYIVPPTSSGLPVRAQSDAPAWAATAGSGDVLAGLAGTLLSAGLPAIDAGSLAALVHGIAAERLSRGGPIRARSLAEELAPTIAALLSRQ
ncbi:yjeF C-terminal region, hydroxyethylthiazole kinase-related/yjeF N-terminal region [Austwickia chelonae]|uniref:ADP-dependent (S)-NAD(P)H-hydrate dehydratase n=1 Tax=Austwickia chelonae NBRC 105200 TaxID=1184607 RepID=K6VRT5_9MICO|nr:bifunctional ADP-dependent NAD(P)H-hydrate dehydratase/NAD(P)H-hydrate epimerase [Austwickia chelonae]GAB78035.1 hypothetical protein AUCHE_08_02790 [Austwickia chelonae NBRC 105200]SEV94807.1 yjeF C-terminal region, hydroxyethylthiazole kinase-related/yjeF N-terminal region [Austwickia chelonae]